MTIEEEMTITCTYQLGIYEAFEIIQRSSKAMCDHATSNDSNIHLRLRMNYSEWSGNLNKCIL